MNIKKYISKKFATQFLLFAAIIGLAILFDIYHDSDSDTIVDVQEIPDSRSIETGHFFVYNPVKPVHLKTSNDHVSRKLYLCTQDKFLQNYHNERTFSLLKVESKIPFPPISLAVHHILFNQHYYSNPDDLPPAV